MVFLLLTSLLLAAAALWAAAVHYNRRAVAAFDGTGDPRRGIVVFVEPVRWLFVVWGFPSFCRGLRRAGLRHQVRLFRWSNRAGSLLILPDLMRSRRLLRKAARLAEHLDALVERHPDSTIHVCGYSSGSFVALEGLRRMRRRPRPGQLLLLAPSISPSYDLSAVRGRVRAVHSFYSPLDLWINGLGPLLFGSNDRRWGPAAGAVGLRRRPAAFVEQHAWRPSDARLGYFGGHFTIAHPAFVAARMAPLIGRNETPRSAGGPSPLIPPPAAPQAGSPRDAQWAATLTAAVSVLSTPSASRTL